MVSRRRFLALGPVLAATAASGPSSIVKDILPKPSTHGAADLTRSTFLPHVNSAFVVHVGPLRRVETTLVAVENLPGASGSAGDAEGRFALLFRGPRAEAFGQDTYHVEHARLGTIALFLVPIGESAGVRHYEAIFNRIGAPPAREA